MWWIARENSPRAVPETSSGISLSEKSGVLIASLAAKDSDGDGLYDWEEELWNTDPKNADSDGDGTSDGDEVLADRHPARAAPDDALAIESSVTLQESIEAYIADESRTETEKVALKLFQGYSELRKSGGLGGTSEEALLSELIGEQFTASNPDIYIERDLTIIEEESAEIVETYKHEYDKVVDVLLEVTENELLTLERALMSGEESDMAKLDTPIAIYTEALRLLLITPVPRSAVTLHLELTNNFSLVLDGLAGMRTALDDPISGSVGLQSYTEGIGRFRTIAIGLRAYFERYGLIETAS